MKLVILLALFTLATCDYPPAVPDEPSSEAPFVPAETYGPPAEVPVSSTELAITSPPEVPEVPVPEVPKTPANVEILKPGTHYPFLPPTVNLFSDLVVPHPIPETFIPERPLYIPEYPIYHSPAPPPIDIPPINIPPGVLPPGVLPPGVLPPGIFPPVQPPVSSVQFFAPPPAFPKPLPIPLLPRPITHHYTTTHVIPPPRVNHLFLEPPVIPPPVFPEYPLLAPPVPAPLPSVYAPPVPLPAPVIPAPFPETFFPEPYPIVPNLPVINEPTPVVPEIPKEPEVVPHVPAPSYGPPLKK